MQVSELLSADAARAASRRIWRRWQHLSPAQLLVLSFAVLITTGWLGFLVLPGLYAGDGEGLGIVDSLFMATSAVCVTGLTVIDVSSQLSAWGQLWLLLLIQAGGLGILTFAGLIVALVGRRSALSVEEAAGGPASVLPRGSPAHLVRTAVGVTMSLELAGAVALWALWRDHFGALHAAWLAVFHSVSAFCNAGFSLFPDSLVAFQAHPTPLVVLMVLIVVGGLGFPVIQDLRLRAARPHDRLTTHSRLVLVTTAGLLAISTFAFLVFESDHTLAPLRPADRLVNALFMAVTPRTAGFNTVDYDHVSNGALFLTGFLMWVGGGPASIAGGVKITTVALLGLLLWARLRGERQVSVWGRTIPTETVQRATGLATGGLVLLGFFLFLLLAAEPNAPTLGHERERMVRLAFETQSALGTVGLSMGVTQNLSPASRLALVLAMLLGRVGPLAVLSAMVMRQRRLTFRYAHEDVLIG